MELIRGTVVEQAGETAVNTRGAAAPEALLLPGSPSLQEFVAAAAEAGLGAEEALRLGIERALLLYDLGELGIDRDLARRRLRESAALARAEIELTADLAAWVRRLSMARAVPVTSVQAGASVNLPDRLLARAGEKLGTRYLRAEAVAEMIAWELAAATSAQTMGEWAFRELALARLLRL
jgi:hypothetical protein